MHIEVQTDVYLEELTDRVEEADIAVQTDPFLDRAPDPVYIPAKTGVDAETQILDGELFDFDLEAQPILEVLVGKTMEQSLMEVMEEEELDRLRDHQLKFEELRNAELIETQRLEEQARRRREEKERRLKQQREVADQEREATKKIAARSFAQSYLSGLVPSVFRNLEDGGYFFDAQEREVETEFIPWLLDGVESELAKFTRARALVDAILAQVLRAQHPKPTSAPKAAPEPATDANAAGEASAAEVSASDEAADPSEGGESSLPPEQDDAKADVSEEVKNDGGAGEATDGDGAAQSNDDGIGDGGPDQASKDGDGETAEPEAAPDGDAA
jgi:TolA-binding protein